MKECIKCKKEFKHCEGSEHLNPTSGKFIFICDTCNPYLPKEKTQRQKDIEKLQQNYPSVPVETYDIEASPEMAEMYLDMFGY